jgi:hypothetical protein
VFTEREERASVAVASNSAFSEWARTFTDPRLCAAIVDRITFEAHIVETGTQSFWRASHIPDTGPNKVRSGMEVDHCENVVASSVRNSRTRP